MPISASLDAAKKSLEELKKKHRYKKANEARQANVELQVALGKCRGQLEACLKEFQRIIRTQSKNIAEGQRGGYDTVVQEQQLWDAAIGYMLVKDAIYALKTIGNHDAIASAYEMLEAATRQMSGKGGKVRHMPQLNVLQDRGIYAGLTSQEALESKEQLLDAFFETLKDTGDIEACLASGVNPAANQAARRASAAAVPGGTSDVSDLRERLNSIPGQEPNEEISADDIAKMYDY